MYAIHKQEKPAMDFGDKSVYDLFIDKAHHSLEAHPFKKLSSQKNILNLLPHFLALSVAFPYIQAGSQLSLIQHAIQNNKDIAIEHEMLSVVSHFLCWDETGGANILEFFGKSALIKNFRNKKMVSCQYTSKRYSPNYRERHKS